jgi:hypothetical protein
MENVGFEYLIVTGLEINFHCLTAVTGCKKYSSQKCTNDNDLVEWMMGNNN